MKKCPYCNYSNYDNATVCRKCENSFVVVGGTVYSGRPHLFGSIQAKVLRSRALSMIVLGLLVKVYWGGYGPWLPVDFPVLVTLRMFMEPLLLYGGLLLYIFGWFAVFI